MALQDTSGQHVSANGGVSGKEIDADAIIEVVDSPAMRKKIASMGKKVDKLKKERKEVSANIQAVYEEAAAKGIPKESFQRAQKDMALDENQIEAQDRAYLLCRLAMGKPVQRSLFPSNQKH